jgi:hypothetical protein
MKLNGLEVYLNPSNTEMARRLITGSSMMILQQRRVDH